MIKINENIIPYLKEIHSEIGLLYKNLDDKMKEMIDILKRIERNTM